MKVYYECGACFLRQACELLDLSSDDENLKFELMNYTFKYLGDNFDSGKSPNDLASVFNQHIKKETGCNDPYFRQKEIGTEIAQSMIGHVNGILNEHDGLETYLKMAIIGNILDFGAFGIDTDVESMMREQLHRPLAINRINELDKCLKKHDSALYLLDNTGEILFDKLLVDKIKKYGVHVCVAVKESPIVNDACFDDALNAGFEDIVSIGCDSAGIVESMISDEFREIFENSGFVISKGMANYEGITEMDLNGKDVFCLLCAKCMPISKDLNVDLGSLILTKL